MGKHILKKFIFLVTVLLILSGAFVFLLNTERGLRFSFTVAAKIIPGKLVAQKINGCLLGPIDIEKGYFENKSIRVLVDKVHLEWKIKDLLLGKINITALHVNNLKITTKVVGASKSNLTLKDITTNLKNPRLPIYLKLKDVELRNIEWQQGTDAPIKIESIVLQSHMSAENIVFLRGELHAQDASILVQGALQKEWDVNWKLHLPNLKNFFQEIEGSLDWEGKIYGERNRPEVNTTINVMRFKYGDISLAKLQGKADIDLSAKKGSWFELNISLPKIDSIGFDQLVFSGGILPVKLNKQPIEFNVDMGATTMFFPVGASSQSLKLEKGSIQGLFNKQGFFSKTMLLLSQHSPINIELNLPKLKSFTTLSGKQLLKGQVIWQTKNLAFLQTALPYVKDIQGALDLQYVIDGTLQDPKMVGIAKLINASFQIPELNIKLKNIELNARNERNTIEYQASMHSGGGVLNLSGKTAFLQDKVDSKILINGTNFLVANTREYHVIASPQLVLQTKNDVLELTGKVFIPQATIKPEYFSRGGLLPTEVVYVKKGEDKKAEDLSLYIDIQLDLGDDIAVDIMGLEGKLQGQLRIVDDPQKTTTALGTLYVKEGSYNIYGQQLKVTKGNLHFFGGVITNPEVNIEAIRDFKTSGSSARFSSLDKELIVGVRMHGMVDNTKIDLFSVPSGLDKSDILSYLIIGQPSSKASENKTQLLLQAASTLNFRGVGGVGNLLGTLKQKLGFSEFGLTEETRLSKPQEIISSKQKPGASLTTNTAFSLGKFLTPRIYVGYSMGFLDLVNVFRVRYYMGKYWSIQSESSSLDNGVDLLYSIERN